MSEVFKKILVSASVFGEIEPLIKIRPEVTSEKVGNKDLYLFDHSGKSIRMIVTGPGMVNASQAVTAAIESDRPEIIIQIGCAGVYKNRGLAIGDVAIAISERDIHLGLESSDPNKPNAPLPFIIPGLEANGEVRIDKDLAERFHGIIKESERDFRVGIGHFITVSTVTSTDERAELLKLWYEPLMESMEGAATAMIANIYSIPFAEFRSASNYVGKRDRDSWNLPLAFENACKGLSAILRNI